MCTVGIQPTAKRTVQYSIADRVERRKPHRTFKAQYSASEFLTTWHRRAFNRNPYSATKYCTIYTVLVIATWTLILSNIASTRCFVARSSQRLTVCPVLLSKKLWYSRLGVNVLHYSVLPYPCSLLCTRRRLVTLGITALASNCTASENPAWVRRRHRVL